MAKQFELKPGQNCWRIEKSDSFSFIIDGDDYFRAVRQAMLQAEHSILLIGWDFDARINFAPDEDEGPAKLGDFILWLADRRPSLQIRLLRWRAGAIPSWFRGSTLWTILRWKAHPRITLRLDGAHPFAGAHHQKIVVIDDSLAFCGGIDMTGHRWDTSEHLDDDPRRIGPDGKPLEPWHDTASCFDGAAAKAIGDLARLRWLRATGKALPVTHRKTAIWPESLPPTFSNMSLAISRTLPKMKEQDPVHEIEEAYLDLIASAKRFIYAESQYFASRKVGYAIAQRLLEEDPPEIVIVNPREASGWLEPLAMDTARVKLFEALRKIDHAGRFRIYHPVTMAGKDIYVHAKSMVVDDQILRVGSSNFNNRSMRLDSECDVILSAYLKDNQHLGDEIGDLRARLMAEHLDVSVHTLEQTFQDTGSLIATIEALRGKGRSLIPYDPPKLSDFAEWLAENEILDPNGPEDLFENTEKRGLFKGWSKLRGKMRARFKTQGAARSPKR